jgi:hypothetical protein
MSLHTISNIHNFNMPNVSGNGRGYGPLVTIPAGNIQVLLSLDGPGTIQLRKADGTVLCQGNGGHRGGTALTFASPTAVQVVVTASNLDLIKGSGCSISFVTPGGVRGELSWSE